MKYKVTVSTYPDGDAIIIFDNHLGDIRCWVRSKVTG